MILSECTTEIELFVIASGAKQSHTKFLVRIVNEIASSGYALLATPAAFAEAMTEINIFRKFLLGLAGFQGKQKGNHAELWRESPVPVLTFDHIFKLGSQGKWKFMQEFNL
jgi:hypothetical protein